MAEAAFDDLSEAVAPAPPGKGRKRKSTESARDAANRIRHSAEGKTAAVSCLHDERFCKAANLTAEDLDALHSR